MKAARRIVLLFAILVVASSSLGLALPQLAKTVSAAGCEAPSIVFGRWKWCGYFYNRYEDPGDQVRLAGVPASVNTAGTFVSLVLGDYASGDTQRITEAVFFIREVI